MEQDSRMAEEIAEEAKTSEQSLADAGKETLVTACRMV